MKFEELLKKTTPGDLVATPAGFLRDKNDDGLPLADVDLDPICDDLERANALRLVHSWNVLPHLLQAHAAREKAIEDFNAACQTPNDAKIQRTHHAMELAFEEFDAAIAAAREVPED